MTVLERKGAKSRKENEVKPQLRYMGNRNTVAKAVAASLQLVQQSSDAFNTKAGQQCVSCHHQTLPALMVQFGREHGFAIEENKAKLQAETMQRLLAGRRERLLEGAGVPISSMRDRGF